MSGVVVARRRDEPPDLALRFAAAEASRRCQQLTLTHVWDLPLDIAVETDAFTPAARTTATDGPVLPALLAQHPELLVLARTSRPRGVSRTIRSCLRRATCPVAVVPAAVDRETEVSRIVVGVSFTDASAAALRWAVQEARWHGATVCAVHVWQAPPRSLSAVVGCQRACLQREGQLNARLRQWTAALTDGDAVDVHASHGPPLERLLDAATHADLLVLGRPRHGVTQTVLHGRLAEDLAHAAPCPVVVVPGAGP